MGGAKDRSFKMVDQLSFPLQEAKTEVTRVRRVKTGKKRKLNHKKAMLAKSQAKQWRPDCENRRKRKATRGKILESWEGTDLTYSTGIVI